MILQSLPHPRVNHLANTGTDIDITIPPAEAGERETLRLLSRFSGEKEGTALQSASEARWEDEGLAGQFITSS